MKMSGGAMLAGAVWGMVSAFCASGAYLESDTGTPRREVEGRLPDEHVIPRPGRDNPLKDLVRRVEVGSPTSYGNMMVFPLLANSRPGWGGIRTLDEAIRRDWIAFREKDSAEVSRVLVRNDSGHYVFMMAGEILTGGRQNRIIRESVLLGPRSEFVAVPVYCGEKERWRVSGDAGFRTEKGLADQGLRRMAAKSAAQGDIWNEIDTRMREANVESETKDYRRIYDDEKVTREADRCVSHYRRFCGSRTVGVVVVMGGEIASCDVLSDPDLVSALWDKLCRSYAVDMLKESHGRHGRPPGVSASDVRRFLDRILDARFSSEETPGEGQRMRIRGSVEGAVLNWRGNVVHASVYPGVRIMRRDGEEPVPFDGSRGGEGKIWR